MELQIIQSKIYEIRGQKVTEEEFEILMSQFAISSWVVYVSCRLLLRNRGWPCFPAS